ncbi:hypothetical protein CDC45_18370 (plasmid) [Ralstonia pseudosolanacearum]|nr:hypothetical protein CDC45_18370 [Ralstonia pseudosolanacearum]
MLGIPVVLARFVLQQVAGRVVLRQLAVHRLHLVQRVRHDRLLGLAAERAGAVVRRVVAIAPVVPAAAIVGQQPVVSWLHNFKWLRIRFERLALIYEAFMKIECCAICWRQFQNHF